VVATPLGNLRDLTLRAIDVLRSADRIAAEDTRVTAKLLAHLGIATRPFSVRAQNEAARAAEIAGALGRGESVALVTDAGTPGVSDPGARVVRAVRDAGHPVVPVPGPSPGSPRSASRSSASCPHRPRPGGRCSPRSRRCRWRS
jgi:16S rRNA (cytidine1402-2'-O)-methyltransferase